MITQTNLSTKITVCANQAELGILTYGSAHHYQPTQDTVICAELAGDFHLGYARQLTDKSSLLFDLAF